MLIEFTAASELRQEKELERKTCRQTFQLFDKYEAKWTSEHVKRSYSKRDESIFAAKASI